MTPWLPQIRRFHAPVDMHWLLHTREVTGWTYGPISPRARLECLSALRKTDSGFDIVERGWLVAWFQYMLAPVFGLCGWWLVFARGASAASHWMALDTAGVACMAIGGVLLAIAIYRTSITRRISCDLRARRVRVRLCAWPFRWSGEFRLTQTRLAVHCLCGSYELVEFKDGVFSSDYPYVLMWHLPGQAIALRVADSYDDLKPLQARLSAEWGVETYGHLRAINAVGGQGPFLR